MHGTTLTLSNREMNEDIFVELKLEKKKTTQILWSREDHW